MLKIRLSRHGRHKRPFFRVVLTEHTKSAKSGYKLVLGWYDPLKKTSEIDIEAVKEWIGKGAQVSPRAAKIMHKSSGDSIFEKFYEHKELNRKTKNPKED